ncbi:hypothetical protein [Enterococcus sp. JM9B]|uniref:hypothetical protein n=1 Tax=Enterococcus sp. JM9B TaxID=1857216 RepID=UPI0013752C9B|nr:hypothetical protein [Enterococcus sp. JM9B]KAF1303686.1 hypothetical protein BAU16_03730 [Enterococcus sp. JM9B]
MTLKIDNAIEEIERALAGNKPKYANDIYLNNAVRYLQEIKSPSLTKDQQIVFEWLKKEWSGRKRHSWLSLECIATLVYHWQHGDPDYYPVHASPHVEAYGALTAVEHLEVLQVFIQWALEQEYGE